MSEESKNSSANPIKTVITIVCCIAVLIVVWNTKKEIDLIRNPQERYDIRITNANVEYASEASVTFRPVCPECDHIHSMYSENISAGEDYSGSISCEHCGEYFVVTIKKGK